MRHIVLIFFTLMLVSCNLPVSAPTETPTQLIQTIETPTFINTETPTSTIVVDTPIPPTTTATPIPCDPLTAEYCITDGYFLFQRPILPPNNDRTDITYLYASTQNRKRDPHHGVEFQNAFGTSVHAAGDGVVVFADADKTVKFAPWTNFYGNVVIIQHANEMYTLYAHLSTILVQAGSEVKAGDVVGQVGATGGATGSHLHFEVRKGSDYTAYFSTENPELWLIPQPGMGALSITLKTKRESNFEFPMVISKYIDDSDTIQFTYYITTYAKGFEHNPEDAVLNSLPAGRYKIAFSDSSGLRERFVWVEAGKLTEVVFDLK